MSKTTMDTPATAAHQRSSRGRRHRRWLLCLGLAGAAGAILFEPVAPAGVKSAGWPASQLVRRGLINCYHAAKRTHDSQPPAALSSDGGTDVR